MGACCSLPKKNRPHTYGAYERSHPTTSGAYYEAQPTTASPSPPPPSKRQPPHSQTTPSSSAQKVPSARQNTFSQLETESASSPSLPPSYPPQWQSPYVTYFPPPMGTSASKNR